MRAITVHAYQRIAVSLVDGRAWDELRERDDRFKIADSRQLLNRQASGEYDRRARGIAAILANLDAETVCSHGAGNGALEAALIRHAPTIRLRCTDYAPQTVSQLQRLLPDADVVQHDLRRDPLPDADVHVFHRVDTELDNLQWARVLESVAAAIFVPGQMCTLPQIAAHIFRELTFGRPTGYARNRAAIEKLWHRTHHGDPTMLGDAEAFILTSLSA